MNYRRDEYEGAVYINNDWFAKIKPLKSPLIEISLIPTPKILGKTALKIRNKTNQIIDLPVSRNIILNHSDIDFLLLIYGKKYNQSGVIHLKQDKNLGPIKHLILNYGSNLFQINNMMKLIYQK